MYRRVIVLMGLALSGVLAGCTSSTTTTISVHATGSFIGLIQAKFRIVHPGTYDYHLTFAHLPPEPGAKPQTCLPYADFELFDEYGGIEDQIAANATGQATGSFYFYSAGTWTGSDGIAGSPSIPNLGPPSPTGTFEALACPWSLTLTPSN
jgi:hypothetical protein